MKSKAILMALAMMTTALAGCTGTDGVTEVDEDALNELIDANLQDFINNTTIVVNNHYHNNTTVVNNDYDSTNQYNNTTNVDGGEVNNYNSDNSNTNYTLGGGGDSSSVMQMFTVEWDWEEAASYYDYGNHTITLDGALQQNSGDPTLLYATYYNGYNVEFNGITCEEFKNYMNMNSYSAWSDYLIDNYGYNSDENYETSREIQDVWEDLYYEQATDENGHSYYPVREQCEFDGSTSTTYVPVFEIEIEQGQAIDILTMPSGMSDLLMVCDDGFSGGSANGSVGQYIGGQSDCTLTGIARVYSYHEYIYVAYYDAGPGSNNTEVNMSTSGWDTANIPEWWPYHWWRFFANGWDYDEPRPAFSSVPESFSVYFMTYFVEVYDPDSE